ncbi:hypothetical protein NKG05_07105 [Oerskovia sp. M15]
MTTEDTLAVLAEYSRGARLTYSLTAYGPWEGTACRSPARAAVPSWRSSNARRSWRRRRQDRPRPERHARPDRGHGPPAGRTARRPEALGERPRGPDPAGVRRPRGGDDMLLSDVLRGPDTTRWDAAPGCGTACCRPRSVSPPTVRSRRVCPSWSPTSGSRCPAPAQRREEQHDHASPRHRCAARRHRCAARRHRCAARRHHRPLLVLREGDDVAVATRDLPAGATLRRGDGAGASAVVGQESLPGLSPTRPSRSVTTSRAGTRSPSGTCPQGHPCTSTGSPSA